MNDTKTAMRVAYLPVNQCWTVAWVDAIIDIDNIHLWPDRKALVRALHGKGLSVARDGAISVDRREESLR